MLKLTKGLDHVIKFHEVAYYKSLKKNIEMQSIIFPMYNMGELRAHLASKNISYKEKLSIASDIIKGLIGLHERGIIHRDIKPANVFLHKSSENGKEVIHAFVGDFGLSCLKENDKMRKLAWGTPKYMPPRVLSEKAIADFHMDIWGLGLTLSKFFKGTCIVDQAYTNNDLITLGRNCGNRKMNPAPKNEKSLEYVIWALLQPNPKQQMSLVDALAKIKFLMEKA